MLHLVLENAPRRGFVNSERAGSGFLDRVLCACVCVEGAIASSLPLGTTSYQVSKEVICKGFTL